MDVREPADEPTLYAAPTSENSSTKAMDALAGLGAGWMTGRWGPKPMIVGHGTNNRGTAAFRDPISRRRKRPWARMGPSSPCRSSAEAPAWDRRHNHSNHAPDSKKAY